MIIAAVILIIICNKLSKRFEATFKPEYYRELSASGLTPSEVIDLMGFYKPVYTDDQRYTSTLLDLSLKGYIKLKKDENLKKDNLLIEIEKDKNINALKRHEQIMLKFLFDIAKNKNEISQSEIKKYVDKNSESVIKIYSDFKKESDNEFKSKGYIDKTVKIHTKWFVIATLLCIVFAVIAGVLSQIVLCACFIILGIISAFCCAGLRRLSQSGEDELALWEGFKKFLKEFTSFNEKELPDIILWEKYIVYAVAVGMGKKILKELPMMYPQLNDAMYYRNNNMYNLYIMYTISNGKASFNDSMFNSVNSIGSNIVNAFSTASSGSGSGGGFSSGGGGGGGGCS